MANLNGLSDADILRRRVLPLLSEATATAQKLDAAGYGWQANTMRSRAGYLDNAARAAHIRALSGQERTMIASHIDKLNRLIAEARAVLAITHPDD